MMEALPSLGTLAVLLIGAGAALQAVEALETVPLLARAIETAGIRAPVTSALARLVALYPSPAGATESELEPATWAEVIGGSRLGIWPLAAWLAPAMIGAPAIALWSGYYRRRFASIDARSILHSQASNCQDSQFRKLGVGSWELGEWVA